MDNEISSKKREKFMKLFEGVMDCNGNMKQCGREACSRLIEFARSIDNSKCYGDTYTGFIDKRALLALYNRLS